MIALGTYRHDGGSLVRVMFNMWRTDNPSADGMHEQWVGYMLLRDNTMWCCPVSYFAEHFVAV